MQNLFKFGRASSPVTPDFYMSYGDILCRMVVVEILFAFGWASIAVSLYFSMSCGHILYHKAVIVENITFAWASIAGRLHFSMSNGHIICLMSVIMKCFRIRTSEDCCYTWYFYVIRPYPMSFGRNPWIFWYSDERVLQVHLIFLCRTAISYVLRPQIKVG